MRIFDLALKDVYLIIRDIRSLLFLVAMPIVFTLFMGFAYRGGGDETAAESAIPLGWVNDNAGGSLSEQLYQLLQDSDTVKLVEVEQSEVDQAVQDGEVAGVLVVPEGFSEQAHTASTALRLVADPASSAGQSLFQALQAPVTQLFSAVEIASLAAETNAELGTEAEWNASFESALQAWTRADTQSLVQMERVVAQEKGEWYGDNPYNQASPGILVQFAIMGMVTSGQILVQERKTRTLQRMMTTNLRPWQILSGHILGMFTLVFLQVALLVIFGQWALGVDYFQAPGAVLLVSVAMSLWIAAMGLLISTVARDDSQVVLFSLIAMFFFSTLGGTWFPLETTGKAFAAIGGLLPSAWAMKGYQNILIRSLGLSASWLPAAVLTLYALGFFVLATWRYRRLSR